jgi:hypothetical protein
MVLPLPVLATLTRLQPESATGQDIACVTVGAVYPATVNLERIAAGKGVAEKVSIGGGHTKPGGPFTVMLCSARKAAAER